MPRHRKLAGERWYDRFGYQVLLIVGGLLVVLAIAVVTLSGTDKINKSFNPTFAQTLTMSSIPGGSPHEPNPPTRTIQPQPVFPVPPAKPTAPSSPVPARLMKPPFLPCAGSLPKNYVCYKIRPGDTLIGISQTFGNAGFMTVYSWNVTSIGRDPNLIHPGVVLVVQVLQ